MTATPFFRPATVATALALAALSFTRSARAEDALAETLYQEGRRAAQAKDWELACKKFRESHDREPAPGTLLNLADCQEHRGFLTDAIVHFEAASKLFRDERATFAKQRAVAIEGRLPKITLRLHPTAPLGTTVERDGRPLEAASFGSPITLDPGEHVLIVRATGRAEARRTIRLAERQKLEVELVPGPVEAVAAAPVQAATPPPKMEPGRGAAPTGGGGALRTAGFVGLGVGAVGLGVGVVGALLTLDAKSTTAANCSSGGCNTTGLDAQDQGKTMSVLSTAGFVTAGVGLVAGAALLFVVPSSRAPAGAVTAAPIPGGSVVGWTGTF